MRIVHVIIDLGTGGAELMLKRLVASAAAEGRDTHRVISLRGLGTVGPQLQALGIEVETLGLHSAAGIPAAILRLRRRLRELRPDVVQTWMYHADLIGGLAARAAGCRAVIWGVRIADISPQVGVSRATTWIRRLCARLSHSVPSRIVYVGTAAQRVHERIGYDARKSVFIPNGYDIPPHPDFAPEAAPLRRELDLPPGAFLVGSAGRFNAQKDHRGFIAAAALVARAEPRARFVLMGRGVDAANPELAGWIRETGMAERFHLLGERRDVLDCMAAMDLFCLHSLEEGFPNVVAEAMSVAIPCVVTDVGDAAMLVDDTGPVVPPAAPEALAAAIGTQLAKSPAERRDLGERARRRIEENFSIAAIRDRYAALYREVAAEAAPGA